MLTREQLIKLSKIHHAVRQGVRLKIYGAVPTMIRVMRWDYFGGDIFDGSGGLNEQRVELLDLNTAKAKFTVDLKEDFDGSEEWYILQDKDIEDLYNQLPEGYKK